MGQARSRHGTRRRPLRTRLATVESRLGEQSMDRTAADDMSATVHETRQSVGVASIMPTMPSQTPPRQASTSSMT